MYFPMVSGTEPPAFFGLPPASLCPRAPDKPSVQPRLINESPIFRHTSLNENIALQESINCCSEKDVSHTHGNYRGFDSLGNHASDEQSDSVMHDQDTDSEYDVVNGMDVDSRDQSPPIQGTVSVGDASTMQAVTPVSRPSVPQMQFQIRPRVSVYQRCIASFHLLKLQFKSQSGGQSHGSEDPEFQISQLRDALVVGDTSVDSLRAEVSRLTVSVSPLQFKHQRI
jgi:hypothetical protein